jgi:hypothetical protein
VTARTAPKRTRCNWPEGCRRLAKPGRKRCEDHKPGARRPPDNRPATRRKLYGFTEARVFTPPLRPLTRETSMGYEVIDFARYIGEPLLPWQEWAVIRALELLPDGSLRFRKVLIKVARQNGKSSLKRIVTLWRMYKYPKCRILGVAQDVSLARDQWNQCQDTIHACPDLEAEFLKPRNVNGDEMFWLTNGARYAIKAANRRAGRGGSNDEVNIDELREQTNWQAWGAVSKTIMAKADGQIWAMTNEGDDTSVVLNQLSDVADAGTDPALCRLEWSAPPGCELDDVTGWQHANPALGYLIDEASIRSDLADDPPDLFRTEVLCQRVPNLAGAVDMLRWNACADKSGTMDGLRNRTVACFDVAPDGAHATLAVAARLDDGRVRVEIAGAWKSTDEARRSTDPDNPDLVTLLDQVSPAAFVWYSEGPAAALGPVCKAAAAKYNKRPGKRQPGDPPENGKISGSAVAACCQGLADLAKSRQVLHPADPLLDAHCGGAQKLPSGDGWRFTRKGGREAGHVDAAYAAAGAADAALTMPEPPRARIRMLAG